MAAHVLALLCAAPAVLNIAGVVIPVDALKEAPRLVIDLAHHAPAQTIGRDTLPIAEAVATALIPIPCLGLAEQIVTFMVTHGKPPTPEEQQRMWDRAQGIQ